LKMSLINHKHTHTHTHTNKYVYDVTLDDEISSSSSRTLSRL